MWWPGLAFAIFAPALLVTLWVNAASGQQGVGDGPEPAFFNYESGPVRPIAMTEDGTRLLVANTPAAQLDVFAIATDTGALTALFSVPVGLEPVAVAARNNNEVWVVNHLSDSVSVVDLSERRVVGTLLVGDEPRDIVFAGPDNARAFVTTAHRGQRRTDAALAGVVGAGDPQLSTPGVGRADAWVFDTAAPGFDRGGVPLAIKSFFTDTPRALAVSPDNSTVYLAGFMSGNQTAVVSEATVCDGFRANTTCRGDGITSPGGLANGELPGGLPGPDENTRGQRAVETSLIVKYDNGAQEWRDELGRNWNNGIRFTLPDRDVFAFDAMTLQDDGDFRHVGTTLFNMVTHPTTGQVFVSNTDAKNEVRFEGHALSGTTTVQGRLALSQITIIDPEDGSVTPRHLNSHIDYDVRPAPEGTKEHSLATPLEMAFDADGDTLYVAAYGSSKVGVIPTDALVDGSLDPTIESANYVTVTGGGPAGLVRNDDAGVMYAFTRFDMGISTIDLDSNTEVSHTLLFNPEPDVVRNGRPVMYDSTFSSSNGEASCASCHIFGDLDALAWDLGNPDLAQQDNILDFELTFRSTFGVRNINGTGGFDLNAMKGPMTTQTLKGMVNHGAMHWRGDRAIGFFGEHKTDARLNFRNFIVAFPELLGSEMEPEDAELQHRMNDFTEFVMTMQLPPNPVRNLDRSFTDLQDDGNRLFVGNTRIDAGVRTCTDCHEMNPAEGRFGTSLKTTFEGEVQDFKIAHIRNMYQKVGMFGMPDNSLLRAGNNDHQGDQVRGTGFTHDGSVDTLQHFFAFDVFNTTNETRRQLEAAMFAADSDLAPVVGQQITIAPGAAQDALERVELLRQRATTAFVSKELGGQTTECQLIAHRSSEGSITGYLLAGPDQFVPDRAGGASRSLGSILSEVDDSGVPVTFSCVTPGSGYRLALDADLDRVRNGDELDQATDPADAASFAGVCADGRDNDGDGQVDAADPGCRDASGTSEAPGCDDGVDGDGDGLIDLDDPSCAGQSHLYESPCPSFVDAQPPVVVAVADQMTTTSTPVDLGLDISDPAEADVELWALGLPPEVRLDPGGPSLVGAPAAAGTYDVIVAASNRSRCAASVSFTWTVIDNAAPVIEVIEGRSDEIGTTVELVVLSTDPEGDLVELSASGLPRGVTFDAETGIISGTVDEVGEWMPQVSAFDGFSTSTIEFTWAVVPKHVVIEAACSEGLLSAEVTITNIEDAFATYTVDVGSRTAQRSMSQGLAVTISFSDIAAASPVTATVTRNQDVIHTEELESCGAVPAATPTPTPSPVATPSATPVPGATPTPAPEPLDGSGVRLAVSCLADNGRIDLNVVNTGPATATYRLEFEGLSPRQTDVAAGDWWRMPVTGRHEGDYHVVVMRDGLMVHDETVTVACDGDAPTVSSPEISVVNACRGGNGYVLFQFVNPAASAQGYVIEFEGVPNRSTSAAGYGASVRAVTGRPDGIYDVRIRRGGGQISSHSIEVTCDAA